MSSCQNIASHFRNVKFGYNQHFTQTNDIQLFRPATTSKITFIWMSPRSRRLQLMSETLPQASPRCFDSVSASPKFGSSEQRHRLQMCMGAWLCIQTSSNLYIGSKVRSWCLCVFWSLARGHRENGCHWAKSTFVHILPSSASGVGISIWALSQYSYVSFILSFF